MAKTTKTMAASRKDILDEMTRDELLAWMRSSWHQRPKRSELLYLRWELQSDALERARRAEMDALNAIDLAERDRLARLFNESKCNKERLRLLEQMEPYGKALVAHMERSRKIDKRQEQVDRLYDQIDVEREKERRA